MGGSEPEELQGREEQFLLATSLLAKMEVGPQALLVQGEQGVGKTAFLLKVLRSAREMGHEVMLARPSSLEASLAFAGLGDLLDQVTDSQLDSLSAPLRQALEGVLLRAESLRPTFDVRAVSLGLLTILRGLAARVPIVLGIDDAEWLDVPTSEAIGFALRRLGGQPVVLVATCGVETGELTMFQRMRDVAVLRLLLEPLSEESLGELIRSRLTVNLPRPTMMEIHGMSGGNPAMALEIACALIRGEISQRPGEPLAPPEGLGQIVRKQLIQLTNEARDALLVTAALDQQALPMVHAVLGAAGRTGVDDAISAGLLELDGDLLRFRWPLTATTAYHEASPTRRQEIHRLLAGIAIEPEKRARHLALASSGADGELAAFLERTADEVHRRGSLQEAADLADLAVQMTPPEEAREATRRQLIAARYRARIGDTKAALESLEAISNRLEAGPNRIEVLSCLGTMRLINGGPHAVRDLLRTASAEAAGCARSSGVVALLQGAAHYLAGELKPAAAAAERAMHLSLEAGDRHLSAIASVLVAAVTFSLGKPGCRQYLERVPSVAGGLGSTLVPLYAGTVEAHVAVFQDDLVSARAALESARENAEAAQHGPLLSLLTGRLAETLCWLGNYREAARLARQGAEVASAVGANALRALLLYSSALADAYEGRIEHARQLARRGEEIAVEAGTAPWAALNSAVLGHVELVLGNAELAVQYFRPLLGRYLGPGSEPGLLRLLPDAIEALVGTGDLTQAQQLISDLEEAGRTLGASWPSASAARCRALLAAANGDLTQAAVLASSSVEYERRLPMPRPLELGRHLLLYGTVVRRLKQRRLAAAALSEARTSFADVGALLWLSRASVDSERLGGRGYARSGLTPTQERVAELVARGLSNREVARALFVTVNTVEDNLKAIYRRLDVHSRSALTYRLVSEAAVRGGVANRRQDGPRNARRNELAGKVPAEWPGTVDK
ncbi:MAG: AAA family ATPase [Candidatus Dormibacteraeota bacterium]|nr:AAA family ATPase [Candidatus Dormibacteraeota bacterium]